MVGFLPDLHTAIIAWLSSWKYNKGSGRRTVSTRSKTGRPIMRIAKSAATMSASRVECDTHPCLFDCIATGKKVEGPRKQRKLPDVDFED